MGQKNQNGQPPHTHQTESSPVAQIAGNHHSNGCWVSGVDKQIIGSPLLQSLRPKPFAHLLLPPSLASSTSSRTYTSPIALFKPKTKAPAKKIVWVYREPLENWGFGLGAETGKSVGFPGKWGLGKTSGPFSGGKGEACLKNAVGYITSPYFAAPFIAGSAWEVRTPTTIYQKVSVLIQLNGEAYPIQ
ncbi:hypothetical protein Tco_1369970 [Tanacetum coccineum]